MYYPGMSSVISVLCHSLAVSNPFELWDSLYEERYGENVELVLQQQLEIQMIMDKYSKKGE